MLLQLKSELRKLLSVRSTYILLVIACAFISLFSYFGTSAQTYETAKCESTGQVIYTKDYSDERLQSASPEQICGGTVTNVQQTSRQLPKEKLLFGLQESVPVMITLVGIILILLVAHEFRYNTINYTLTISNSRSKVLAAKLIVGAVFAIVTTLFAIGLSLAVTFAAISAKDLVLPAQDYDWLYVIGRHLVYGLAYALFTIGLAVLVRNLTMAIAAYFVLPTLDGILSMLLANRDIEPTKTLPFTALDRFGNVASDIATGTANVGEKFLNTSQNLPATAWGALAVFAGYFVVLWVVTWVLFTRRDAN